MSARRGAGAPAATGDLFAPVAAPEDVTPGGSATSAVAVSTLTELLKQVVEGAVPPLWVRGEVTNFKQHRNGHWYFTLRDAAAQLRCVVWARDARRLPTTPDEGMQVAAFGRMDVYAARAELQLAITKLEAAGDGLWRKAFEEARARLESEGLLDPARKRPLPESPRTVAVITSPDGAALHDIIAVATARDPGVDLVVVPAAVQGDGAPASLIAALDRVARWGGADCVIIGRGGGSREDLWAFNDEALARAVAACPVPIVSAVGHEVDVSLTDLTADLRAATPSNAAELVVPVRAERQARLARLGPRLAQALAGRVQRTRRDLERSGRELALLTQRRLERQRAQLGRAAAALEALSPLATLARGYVVALGEDGRLLTERAAFPEGETFTLRVRDGTVRARVLDSHPLP
jgi:exodeoxyribonuclease VII large subunit